MSILPVLKVPDPILRRRSKRVTKIDPSIQKLIDDMLDTMYQASGVGLAAPQVGALLRVIVIHIPGEEEPIALINPKLVRRTGEREVEEGCLSIPGYRAQIKRSERVVVKGLDRQGREVRIKAQELLAQALEHEMDHLNGILYIDYLESMDKLYKVEPQAAPAEVAEVAAR